MNPFLGRSPCATAATQSCQRRSTSMNPLPEMQSAAALRVAAVLICVTRFMRALLVFKTT